MYTQPDGYILQFLARGFHITAQIVVGIMALERLVVLNWAYSFHRYNTERRTRIICIWLSSLCIPTSLSLLCSTKTYKLWSGITGLLFAHQIRISEILPCVSKSYLTHAIYPGSHVRATYIGCIGTHAHGRQVTSLLCLSDVIMYNCILSYSGTSGSL